MIEFLSSWAQGIIVAVIIATLIEMILPNSSSKKYVKVVIGMYILFTIVSPIIKKLGGKDINLNTINIEKYEQQISKSDNTISRKFEDNNTRSIKDIYVSNLKADISAKLKEKGYEIDTSDIQIKDDENYTIEKITLKLIKMEQKQEKRGVSALFQPVDLTQGTCWKTILVFSLPIILSYLLQQVDSISDAAIVGQTLTAQEVAGVNDTTSLVFIFLQFAFGVSAGFCVITSCSVGCHDQRGVRRSFATQIILSAALTVLLTAIALLLLNPMLAWLNITPDNQQVYRAAYTYCAVIFAGIGAQLFYNFICSFLRSLGDSVTPLLFLLFSTILNVGLDLLFILSFRWVRRSPRCPLS